MVVKYAIFSQFWLNQLNGRGNIGIFQFSILRGPFCIIMPNYVKTVQTVSEMW